MRHPGIGHFEIQKIGEFAISRFLELVLVRGINRYPVNQTLLHRRRAARHTAGEINKLHVFVRHQPDLFQVENRRIFVQPRLTGAKFSTL
jgi:hypothetical protein